SLSSLSETDRILPTLSGSLPTTEMLSLGGKTPSTIRKGGGININASGGAAIKRRSSAGGAIALGERPRVCAIISRTAGVSSQTSASTAPALLPSALRDLGL